MRVTLRIKRYNPEKDTGSYFQDFELDAENEQERILDLLQDIKSKYDGTLTFRRSCGHGICGSDGMKIAGHNRLACQTLLRDVNHRKPILMEPLPSMPVIKDLVVDQTNFFRKYEAIKPYFVSHTPPPADGERLQSNEDAERTFEAAKCILCACCTSSCPSIWSDPNYVGPAALVKVSRFVFDSRDEAMDERLDLVDVPDGAWRCRTIFNCVEACPKEINVTWHISALKRELAKREI